MYSVTQVDKFDAGRHCLNCHRISPLAKFCEECGAPGRRCFELTQELQETTGGVVGEPRKDLIQSLIPQVPRNRLA